MGAQILGPRPHAAGGGGVTEFLTVEPNMCGHSVWYLVYVNFLAPRIWRWLSVFCKLCASLYIYIYIVKFTPEQTSKVHWGVEV